MLEDALDKAFELVIDAAENVVEDSVGDALEEALEDETEDVVEDSKGDALEDALEDAAANVLEDALEDALASLPILDISGIEDALGPERMFDDEFALNLDVISGV